MQPVNLAFIPQQQQQLQQPEKQQRMLPSGFMEQSKLTDFFLPPVGTQLKVNEVCFVSLFIGIRTQICLLYFWVITATHEFFFCTATKWQFHTIWSEIEIQNCYISCSQNCQSPEKTNLATVPRSGIMLIALTVIFWIESSMECNIFHLHTFDMKWFFRL